MPGNIRAFCINKTNSVYKIYDIMKNNALVGKINPRESYVIQGGEGDILTINFLDANGKFQIAAIDNYNHPLPGNNAEYGYPTGSTCLSYPRGTAQMKDGIVYKTFIMRSSQIIYKGDGTKWGSVAAGCLVATNSFAVGESYPNRKLINYVQRSDGQWFKVEGAGYGHGFVDTGIRSASSYSKIAFYGSW